MQFLPFPRFKKSIRCLRCAKRYASNNKQCPHCAGVKDGKELDELMQEHQSHLRGSRELGIYFIFASAVVLLIMSVI